jgi:hypothetical protein
VTQPIENIYIVAPNEPEILDFCLKNELTYIDELTVIGYGPKQINLINPMSGANRSGWLFQQLIKLSGQVGTCQHYLCIDADHVLLQPHVFFTEQEQTVFYMSAEYHAEYYANLARLSKDHVNSSAYFSYIAHKMLFDKQQLDTVRNELSTINNTPWDLAILASLDRTNDAGFSEFELYGNYYPAANKLKRPWNNLNLKYEDILSYNLLQKTYAHKYKALTFSEWMSF